MRTVHNFHALTAVQSQQPKVPGWRYSGLIIEGRDHRFGRTPAETVIGLLGHVISSTRQVRLLRTTPSHPWHFLHLAQTAVKQGRFREALSLLLAHEGDPILQNKDAIFELRDAVWKLDRLCGRPHNLMRPHGFYGYFRIRTWVADELNRRFLRMARRRYARAVRAEQAAAGRTPTTVEWQDAQQLT